MDKNKILKVVGLVCTVVGAVCLFIAGTAEAAVAAIVGGVFVLAALVIAILKS